MAWQLQGADPTRRTAVVLVAESLRCGVWRRCRHRRRIRISAGRAARSDLINAHPDCLAEILVEYPYLQSRYEEYRMLLDDRGDRSTGRGCSWMFCGHAEETYKTEHGRGHEALAAAASSRSTLAIWR